jgi:hypothetical protein
MVLPLESNSWYPDPLFYHRETEARLEVLEHTYLGGCLPKKVSNYEYEFKMSNVPDFTYDARQHLIQHRAETPPVHLVAVRKTLDYFRGKVFGRATKGRRRIGLWMPWGS